MRRSLACLLYITAAVACLAAPLTVSADVWDAFVYPWVTVWHAVPPGGFTEHHNSGPDYGIHGNPIEGYDDHYPQDRFSFAFDGHSLSVNRGKLKTAGNSNAMTIELVLAGRWAVCGSVSDNHWTPDPYASLSDDQVIWAPDTPIGYTTSLLIGYSFEGDYAATFDSGYYGNQSPVSGTALINWSGYNYSNYVSLTPHSFTLQYGAVPETSSLLAVLVGLVGIGRRRFMDI